MELSPAQLNIASSVAASQVQVKESVKKLRQARRHDDEPVHPHRPGDEVELTQAIESPSASEAYTDHRSPHPPDPRAKRGDDGRPHIDVEA